jgi:DNA-binding transcriptional ArsR family regulator
MSRQETRAIAALDALAQPTRIGVFRRLVKAYPDAIAAGELARQCKAPHNTMSSHLAILTRARLVSVRKEGRMMHYSADLAGFQSVMHFLLQDCCQGRAEICAPLVAQLSCCPPVRKKTNA